MAFAVFWYYEHYHRRENIRLLRAERRRLRDSMNPYELPENEFLNIFRLNKDAVKAYIEELRPYLRPHRRNTSIPLEIRIFCALNFFATGSYQKVIGQSFVTNMSQTMVSNIIDEVVSARIEINRWIWFPRNNVEKGIIKEGFYRKFNLSNIIGAIDGTHVAIIKPKTVENVLRGRNFREEDFINRKGYHSINVQIICDAERRILSVNASFPGRSHDSFIWTNSRISELLRANYENGEESYLLGDSGYPQLPYLLTPVANPVPNSPEERYNDAHIVARCTIERCIGTLKGRFRCLLKHRTLHYEPHKASRIILTCCMLHNIALHYNSHIDRLRYDEIDEEEGAHHQFADRILRAEGQQRRQQYIAQHFV